MGHLILSVLLLALLGLALGGVLELAIWSTVLAVVLLVLVVVAGSAARSAS